MSLGAFAAALIVIFVVFVVALAGEFLYVIWHHHSFRRRSSPPPPPIRRHDDTPINFSVTVSATKELLYFFGLKPHSQVELDTPAGAPNKNNDGTSPDDQVVDVFKLLDAKGQSRFLGTNKEDDKEEVKSEPDVDFLNKPAVEVTMAEAEEVVAVTVDRGDGNTKTVFSTPCDSPTFFTPVGSPSRDLDVALDLTQPF